MPYKNIEDQRAARMRSYYKHKEKELSKTREWQARNQEKIRAARLKRRAATEGYLAKQTAKYTKKYPEKNKAHYTVSNHTRSGRLIRKPCEVCGATKVEAHHDDYNKPLEVRWLCKKHHMELHRTFRKIPN